MTMVAVLVVRLYYLSTQSVVYKIYHHQFIMASRRRLFSLMMVNQLGLSYTQKLVLNSWQVEIHYRFQNYSESSSFSFTYIITAIMKQLIHSTTVQLS